VKAHQKKVLQNLVITSVAGLLLFAAYSHLPDKNRTFPIRFKSKLYGLESKIFYGKILRDSINIICDKGSKNDTMRKFSDYILYI